MSSSISFESGTAIWTVINFLILLVLVHRFALPSFYKMVDDSEARRNALLTDLESKVGESDRLIAEYRDKISAAELSAAEIISSAQKEAEELRRQQIQSLTEEKQRILSGVQAEILSEKKRAVDDVRVNAAGLIVSATSKILKREVAESNHMDLIRSDLAEFESAVKA
ncbi:ATP synthase F0 subunit B [bacterium]|nr:ATP synthase F0 subunit B [bacterium]